MPYELHIKRNNPITIDEWLKTVESTNGLKIDKSDNITVNPKTKEKIKIFGSDETAAMWFSESGEWIKVFRFRRGRVSFNVRNWDDKIYSVRDLAFTLARKLNAEIVGDNGEIYTESK